MYQDRVYIDENSDIPLFGVDFLGIIDRGTNVIEVKPVTICNLKCKYCFVSAGDYKTNFIVNANYLLEKIKDVVEIKGKYDIEIHIAPYGESLLYPELYELIDMLWKIKGIETISMQSNGLLLTKKIIESLSELRLTRINLSLNTLDEIFAKNLCNCSSYDMSSLLNNIKYLLLKGINVLLAPVWFPGENDKDIEEIIKLVKLLKKSEYSKGQLQIGIQKYLIYKTGRKLKKIRPKSWKYFYKQLTNLEKKYDVKLKLGPQDFGIHKRLSYQPFSLEKGDLVKVKIVSKGRWRRECIGKISEKQGIKILLNKPLYYSQQLLGKEFQAKVIKANFKDNILTASIPFR